MGDVNGNGAGRRDRNRDAGGARASREPRRALVLGGQVVREARRRRRGSPLRRRSRAGEARLDGRVRRGGGEEPAQDRLPRGGPRGRASCATAGRASYAGTSRIHWSPRFPGRAAMALVATLPLEKGAAGIVVLGLGEAPSRERLAALERFLRHAAAAVEKAREAEGRTVGLLAAIERLTSLYDVTKAFGSTIDLGELSAPHRPEGRGLRGRRGGVALVLRLRGRETSPWRATAVNGNYDVANPPEFVGGSIVGDVLADQVIVRKNALEDDDPLRNADPSYETRSVLAVPLVEDDAPIGVLVAVEQARAPSGVHGGGRGTARRRRAAGRGRPAQRAAVRGREEGRGAGRPARGQPRDHLDPRPRQGDAGDRQRDVRADPLRPLRARDPPARERCGSGRSPGVAEVDRKDASIKRTRGAPRMGLLRRGRTSR